MATDNAVRYGFRFVKSRYGGMNAPLQEAFTATSAAFTVTGGAQTAILGAGDPILQVSDGSVINAIGSEGTDSTTLLGIVCGIKQYYDATRGVMTAIGDGIPSTVAWGTNLQRQSRLYFIPVEAAIWAIQVDDNTTFTTEATYQAVIGENCRFINTGAAGATRLSPKLDISTHATTNTFPWKIIGLSQTAQNQDYGGNNVELYVISNGTLASNNAILGI